MIQAFYFCMVFSSVLYDSPGLERQAVIQTYLKPLKKYDKKKKAIKNNKPSE